MGIPTGWEFVVLLLVLLLLFGAKRLPDTARGLGRSLRILKAETRGLRDDNEHEVREERRAETVVQETKVLEDGTREVRVTRSASEADAREPRDR